MKRYVPLMAVATVVLVVLAVLLSLVAIWCSDVRWTDTAFLCWVLAFLMGFAAVGFTI